MVSKSKKHRLSPGFIGRDSDRMRRTFRKTILFNEKERSVIDQYCMKYSIRNRSAFFRDVIIAHILKQIDDNYPKLF